jgi:pimeloyl-ACP methyl ester carboxylesterase
MRLRLLFGIFGWMALVTSCRVDRAIEAEDSWFYSRRPTEHFTTSVGRDSIHWAQVGQGPDTLVLVHGFGPYPSVQWQPVVWKFSPSSTILVVDLLGFGESSAPDSAISVHQQVEVLHAALTARGIRSFHLVGHSYGGMVSTLFASRYPETLKSLVLIDPLHRHYHLEHLDSLERQWGRPIQEVLLPRDVASYDAMMSVSVHDPFFLPEFVKQQVLDNIYSVNLGQREAMLRAVRRDEQSIRNQAVGARIPTLIVWGAEDRLFPVRGSESLARDFPNSSTVVVPKAGHIPHMERPFVVLDALADFFSAQSPK